MAKQVRVTTAQVRAAQMVKRRAEERGEEVSPAVQKIIDAKVARPDEPPTTDAMVVQPWEILAPAVRQADSGRYGNLLQKDVVAEFVSIGDRTLVKLRPTSEEHVLISNIFVETDSDAKHRLTEAREGLVRQTYEIDKVLASIDSMPRKADSQ